MKFKANFRVDRLFCQKIEYFHSKEINLLIYNVTIISIRMKNEYHYDLKTSLMDTKQKNFFE